MDDSFEKKSLIEFMDLEVSQAKKGLDSTSRKIYKLDRIISVLKEKSKVKINLKELIGMSEKELYTGILLSDMDLKILRILELNS